MAARPVTPPEDRVGTRQTLITAWIKSPSKRPHDADEAGSPPTTPSKRACPGNILDTLINNLSDDFGFNLQGQDWTPSKRRDRVEEECRVIIRHLYWFDHDGLMSCIQKFRTLFTNKDRTIFSFAQLLKAQRTTSQLSPRLIRSVNSSRTTSVNTSFACSVPGLDTAQTSFSSVSQESKHDPPGGENISFGNLSPNSQEVRFLTENWDAISGHPKNFRPRAPPIEETISPKLNNSNKVQKPSGLATVTGESHVHYKIRDLPQAGLFVDNLPTTILKASPRVRYEMVRISNECNVPIDVLPSEYEDDWENYNTFHAKIRDILSKYAVRAIPHSSQRAWDSAGLDTGSEHVLRTAKLTFDVEPAKPLFKLNLNPLSHEPTSTRFFRRFGAHRFLKVFIPALKTIPAKIGKDREALHHALLKWLAQADKPFMGYYWNAFHTKFKKERRKKRIRGKVIEEADEYQVYFFATSGVNLETYTIADLLNWFMPIDRNLDQPYCKAYARLELGVSMTYSTLEFKPSQIITVRDILANFAAEELSFDDHSLQWPSYKGNGKGKVMNDGCARISTAAAKMVWAKLNQTGHCPSAFQARIGCWKGLWFVDESTDTSNDDVWIQVSDSQQKFQRHPEDLNEGAYDPCRMTFEVITWSRKPSTSAFYLDFLPILEDRGVLRHTMQTYVVNALNTAFVDVETALGNPATLLKWLDENCSISDGAVDGKGAMAGAMPKSTGGQIKKLLESGFVIGQATHESSFLSDLVYKRMEKRFLEISSALDLPIPRSTFVFGTADPTLSLQPNEIHFVSSQAISDEPSPFLHDVEVLVARHPALRRSDIQKVKAVFKPELRHIVDVVVFSTNGTQPLASKLQGGDYDGDMFWLCWQEEIVESFRNAPAPVELPPPEKLGIEVDRRKLRALFSREGSHKNEDCIKDYLNKCFLFSWHFSYLGVCTNYLNDLSYSTNTIHSDAVNDLANLHDHLVDSAKNGYIFGEKQWIGFKQKLTGGKVRITKPAYKDASKKPLSPTHSYDTKRTHSKSEPHRNVVDYLIFDVAQPCAFEKLHEISKKIRPDGLLVFDPEIAALHKQLLLAEEDPFKSVRDKLHEDIERTDLQFRRSSARSKNNQKMEPSGKETKKSSDASYDDRITDAYHKYQVLQPAKEHLDHPTIRSWLDRQAPNCPNYWECLKASVVVAKTKLNYAFSVAGNEICHMKAHSSTDGPPRSVVPSMIKHMKIKNIKDATITTHHFEVAVSDPDGVELAGDSEDDTMEGVEDYILEIENLRTRPAFGLDGASDNITSNRSISRQERDVSPSPRPNRATPASSRNQPRQSPPHRMHNNSAQNSIPKQPNFHSPKPASNKTPPLDPESCSEESDFHDALELAQVHSAGPKPVEQDQPKTKKKTAMHAKTELKTSKVATSSSREWEMQLDKVSEKMASQHLDEEDDEVEAAFRAILEAEAEMEG